MDPKIHPLTTVQKLIDKIRPVDRGTYYLYVENHEMHICRCKLVPKGLPIIAVLSTLDINTGIITMQWNLIDAKIRRLTKQGIIEWHHQKP